MPAQDIHNLNNEQILSTAEAAKMLGVSATTLRRLEQRGKITAARRANGYRVFLKSDLLTLKKEIEIEGTLAKQEFLLELSNISKKAETPTQPNQTNQTFEPLYEPRRSEQPTTENNFANYAQQPSSNQMLEAQQPVQLEEVKPEYTLYAEKPLQEQPVQQAPYYTQDKIDSLSDAPNLASFIAAKTEKTFPKKHTEIPLEEAFAEIKTAEDTILPNNTQYIRTDDTSHHMRVLEIKNVLKSRMLAVSGLVILFSITMLGAMIARDAPSFFNDILAVKSARSSLFSFDKFKYQIADDTQRATLENVLASTSSQKKLVFGVGVATNLRDTLSVAGLSNLAGGLQTNFVDFSGTGEIRNLGALDDPSKGLLQERLDIAGEVISLGLNNAVIGVNVIDDDNLVDVLGYTGVLNLAGDWQIDGVTVTATAEELNLLSGIASLSAAFEEINLLQDITSEEGGIYFSDGSTFTQDAESFYYNADAIQLGIGTNSPEATLHVEGDLQVTEQVTFNGVTYTWPGSQGTADFVLTNNGSGTLTWRSVSNDLIEDDSLDYDKFIDAMTVDDPTTINLYNGTANVSLRHYNSNTSEEILFLDGEGDGNVGIGTVNPTTKLYVNGDATVTGAGIFGNGAITLGSSAGTDAYINTNGSAGFAGGNLLVNTTGNLQVQSGYGLDTQSAGLLSLGTSNATSIGIGNTAAAVAISSTTFAVNDSDIYVNNSGNVGIGTTNPQYLLDVNGDVRVATGSDIVLEGELLRTAQLGDRTYTQGNYVTDAQTLTSSVNLLDIALYSIAIGESGIWRDQGAYIYPQDATNIVITDSGRIGIGTTAPATAFEVLGEIRGTRFAFQDDSDTYIDTLGANIIAFSTGGITQTVIDALGNVGIGTTAPGQLLNVNGAMRLSASAAPGAPVSGDIYNSGAELNYYDGSQWVQLSEQLWQLNENNVDISYDLGNVGIGTTGPSTNLEVLGANANQFLLGYDASNITQFGVSSGGDLTITPSGSDITFAASVLTQINSSTVAFAADQLGSGNIFELRDSGTAVMTVANGGNVGIGTTAPTQALEISGGNVLIDNNQFLQWYTSGGNTGDILGINGNDDIIFGDLSNQFDDLMFMTTGETRLFIQDGGNVGIGTTNPGSLLDITEDDDTDIVDILAEHTAFTGDVLTLRANEESNGAFYFVRMVADADGTPVDVLTIAADGSVTFADGALVDLSAIDMSSNQEGLIIPQSTTCGNSTQDGQICWDTDDNKLYMGQGGSTVLLNNLADSEWISVGSLLIPASVSDNIGIGGITDPSSDILLNADGSAIFNQLQNDADFRISSTLQSFLFFVDSGLNFIGIGTSTPSDTLAVSGGALIGSGYASAGSSAPANGLLVQGNVGIGTTTASQKLDVRGNIRVDGSSDFMVGTVGLNDNGLASSGASLVGLFDNSFVNVAANTTVQGGIGEIDSAIGSRAYTQDNYITDAEAVALSLDALDQALFNLEVGNTGLWRDEGTYIYPSNSADFAITDAGRLGVGTTNPSVSLEVIGEIRGTRFAFQDDTDTYIDTQGANEILFATGGSTKLVINTNGNLGIGTTAPSYKLDVNGDVRVAAASDYYVGTVGLNDNTALTSGSALIGVFDNTYSNIAANTNVQGAIGELDGAIGSRAYSEQNYVTDAQSLASSVDALDMMLQNVIVGSTGLWLNQGSYIYASNYSDFVITNTGRLGIGTTSPSTALEVAGNITVGDDNWLGIGATFERITFDANGDDIELLGGNVGIGNTNPVYTLDVSGDVRVAAASDYYVGTVGLNDNASASSGASLIGLYDNTYSNIAANTNVQGAIGELDSAIGTRTYTEQTYVTDAESVTVSLDELDMAINDVETGVTGLWLDMGAANYIYADNANNVVITDSGRLGVGTTSPSVELEVVGEIRGTRFAFQDDTDTYIDTLGANTIIFATNGSTKAALNSNGNLGIGTTNPTYKLDVNGDVRVAAASDYYVGTVGLNDNTALTSGSALIGVFDDTYSNIAANTNVQGAIGELDSAIGTRTYTEQNYVTDAQALTLSVDALDMMLQNVAAGNTGIWLDQGSYIYPVNSTNLVITDTGRLGVGTTSPADTLAVSGGAIIGAGYASQGSTAPANGLIVQGNLGIGTTRPSYKLDVNGDVRVAAASDYYVGTVGLNDNASASSGASLIGLYDNTYSNIAANTNVQGAIGELDSAIGTRTYTEQTYVTDAESVTVSLDELDMAINDVETGVTGLWLDMGAANYIYADNANNVVITDSGRLGVGTTSPSVSLEIVGEARAQRFAFQDDTDTYIDTLGANTIIFATNGSTKAALNSNGNLGIGTTNPTYKLDVNGDVRVAAASDYYVGTVGLNDNTALTSGSALIGVFDDTYSNIAANTNVQGAIGELDSAIGTRTYTEQNYVTDAQALTLSVDALDMMLQNVAAGNTGIWLDQGSYIYPVNSTNLVITDTGRLGVGTTSPADTLAVSGGAIIGAGYASQGSTAPANGLIVQGNLGIGTTRPSYKLDVNGDVRVAAASDYYVGTVGLNDNASASSGASLIGLYDNTYSNIAANTNVQGAIGELDSAIGTRTYTEQNYVTDAQALTLSVNALDTMLQNVIVGSTGLWLDQGAYINATNYTNMVVTDSGRVGIGTTAPAVELEVVGEIRGTRFAFQDDSDTYFDTFAANGISFITGGSSQAVINSSGNLGIGTTSPTYRLDVNGDVRVSIGNDYYINSIGLNDNSAITSGASLIGLFDNGYANISANTDVQSAIGQLDSAIGNRSYTEQNYVTNAESAAASLNSLDMALYDVESGSTGLWRESAGSTYIYPANFTSFVLTDGGRVGIGTTAPSDLLAVSGGMLIGSGLASAGNTAPTNGLFVEGNVGIGSTKSSVKLAVASPDNADVVEITASNVNFSNDILVIQTNEEITGNYNYIKFVADIDGVPTNVLTIDQNGKMVFIDGGAINLSAVDVSDTSEGLILPQSNSCGAGTADGQICWDSALDELWVGDGSSQLRLTSLAVQEWTQVGDMLFPNVWDTEDLGIGGSTPSTAGIYLSSEGDAVFNEMSNAVDFRVEGDNDQYNLFVDGSTNNVGIGTSAPTYKLDVNGDARVAGGSDFYVGSIGLNDNASTSSGASLVGLFDNTYSNIAANTTVQGAIGELDGAVGTRAYTEDNYVVDAQSLTASINALDMMLQNAIVGSTGLWLDQGAYIYATNASNVVITDAGRVGIGTTTPSVSLEVAGEVRGTRFAFQDNANTYIDTDGTNELLFATNGSARMLVDASGNVGVGTTNPQYLLHVAGATSPQLVIQNPSDINGDQSNLVFINDDTLTNIGGSIDVVRLAAGSSLMYLQTRSGGVVSPSIAINENRNVGIGTTAPAYRLDVNGDARVASGSDFYVGTVGMNDNSGVASGASLVGLFDNTYANIPASTTVQGAIGDIDSAIGNRTYTEDNYVTDSQSLTASVNALDMMLQNVATGTTGLWLDTGAFIYPSNYTSFAITDTGRLGIGTTAPATALEVVGEARATRYAFQDDSDTYIDTLSGNEILFVSNGANQALINANGNLGIGTTAPTYKLQLSGATSSQLLINNTNDTNGDSSTITFVNDDTLSNIGAQIDIIRLTAANSLMYLQTRSGGVVSPSIAINENRNVGIGTTAPAYRLDVNGDARVASGSDFYVGTVGMNDNSGVASGASLVGLFDNTYANIPASTTVQGAIGDIDSAIGNRAYTNNYLLADSQSVTASLEAIDAAFGNRTYTNDYVVTDSQTLTASIDALDTAFGNRTYTEDNYVTDSQSLTASVNALDMMLQNVASGSTGLWLDTGAFIYPSNYTSFAITDTGRLGIGTTAPATALEVVGEARATRYAFQDDSDTYIDTLSGNEILFVSNGANQALINANGNLGIGTTAPAYRLDVNGDARVASGSDFYVGTVGMNDNSGVASGASLVGLFDNTYANIPASTTVQGAIGDIDSAIGNRTYTEDNYLTDSQSLTASVNALDMMLQNVATGTTGLWLDTGAFIYPSNYTSFAITDTGRLGIGTTAPATALEVVGEARATRYAFQDDSDTYIDTLSGNEILFVSNGANQALINANGNLGIGTTAPSYRLDVNGDARVASGSDFYVGTVGMNDNSGVASGASLVGLFDNTYANIPASTTVQGAIGDIDSAIGNRTYTEDNYVTDSQSLTASVNALDMMLQNVATGTTGLWLDTGAFIYPSNYTSFAITDTGRLGIGTTAPATALEVVGEARATRYAFQDDSDTYIDTLSGNEILFVSNGANQALINANGNLGIGTTAPSYKLDVNGDIRASSASDFYVGTVGMNDNSGVASGASLVGLFDNTYANIPANTTVQGAIGDIDSAIGNRTYTEDNYVTDSQSLTASVNALDIAISNLEIGSSGLWRYSPNYIYAQNATDVVVANTGRLGIGTTAPATALEVVGEARATRYAFQDDSDTYIDTLSGNEILFVSNGANQALINANGNLGIGTTAPSYKLDVNGDIRASSASDFYVGTVGMNDNSGVASGASLVGLFDNTYANIPANTTVQGAIGDIDSAIGNRAYTNNYLLADSQSVTASLEAIDAAFGNRTYTNDYVVTDSQTLTASIDALDTAFGNRTYTEDNYVTDSQSLTASVNALDMMLQNVASGSTGLWVDAAGYIYAQNASNVVVADSGNFGIGTTNPTYRLDVNGDARVASGSDFYVGTVGMNDNSGVASGASLVGLFDNTYANIPANTTVQGAIGDIDSAIGNRAYTNNYLLADSQSVTASLEAIDAAFGNRTYTNDYVVTDSQTLTASIDALDTAFGNRTYTEDNYVTDSQSLTASVNALDMMLQNVASGSTGLWVDAAGYIYAQNASNVVVADSGNFGIGTTNPTYRLDVNGDARVASGSDFYVGTVGMNDNSGVASGASLVGLFDNTYANIPANTTVQGAIGDIDSAIGNRAYTNNYLLADSQSVTASLEAIDAAFGNRTYTNDYVVTDSQTLTASIDALDTAFGNRTYTEDNYVTDSQSLTASVNALDMMLQNVASGSTGLWVDAAGYIYAQNASNVVVADSGNFGIGTTNPTYRLDVNGDARVASGSDFYVGTVGMNDNSGVASGASLVGLFDNTYANIPANTTVQGAIGDIDSAIGNRAYTNNYLLADSQSVTASLEAIDAAFGNRTYTNDYVVTDSQTLTASIDALDTAFGNRTYTEDNYVTDSQSLTASVNALDMMLQNVASGSTGLWVDAAGYIYAQNASNVVVADSGNFGIGTTNPTYRLDVNGDARVASGSDFYVGTVGMNDNSGVASGASLVGLFDNTYANIPANTTVQGAIGDIDSAIGNRTYTEDNYS